jgi:hypothetical protein
MGLFYVEGEVPRHRLAVVPDALEGRVKGLAISDGLRAGAWRDFIVDGGKVTELYPIGTLGFVEPYM